MIVPLPELIQNQQIFSKFNLMGTEKIKEGSVRKALFRTIASGAIPLNSLITLYLKNEE